MRGGKREGSGRKKGEPTKTIRVPESLIDEVKKLIERHKKKKVQNESRNKNQLPLLNSGQLLLLQDVMIKYGKVKSKSAFRNLTSNPNKCKNVFLEIVGELNDNDFETIKEVADLYRMD